MFLLVLSIRDDWHLKSIEYRLLAELFRKQKTLATLGWALSIGGVEHLADSEGLSWVAWLLAATQRASPFPHCEIDDSGVTKVRVDELKDLIVEQIEYHEQRREASREAAERLEHFGAVAFLLLGVLALLRMGLPWVPAGWHAGVSTTFSLLGGRATDGFGGLPGHPQLCGTATAGGAIAHDGGGSDADARTPG